MRVWNALIDGPADTCYEDGLFTLRMEFAGNTLKNKTINEIFFKKSMK